MQFHGRAAAPVLVFGVACVIDAQQAGLAGAAATAVQLAPGIAVGIDTHADQSLGEARLPAAHQAVGPLFGVVIAFGSRLVGIARSAVTSAMAVVAAVVDAAVEHPPGAVFDKAVGARLIRFGRSQRAQECQQQGRAVACRFHLIILWVLKSI